MREEKIADVPQEVKEIIFDSFYLNNGSERAAFVA